MRIPSLLKHFSTAGAMVAALALLHPPADAAPADSNAIVVAPAKGELAPPRDGDELPPIRVTFPAPMVDLDKVQRGGQPSPIVFEPTVEIRWMWLSQTEGKITFPSRFLEGNRLESAAEIFRIRHRAKLRPGLRDLAGNPVDAKTWGVEFADDQFALKGLQFLNVPREPEEEHEEPAEPETQPADKPQKEEEPAEEDARFIKGRSPEAPLPARPRLRLEFSRDVTPQDVVRAAYFQDRKTGERFPVEVNLEERQQLSPQGWFLVEPTNPLPPGRAFLLVIERLKEPEKGEMLPVLRTVPAGSTYAPEIKDARGYNQPMKGAFLRAVGNQGIELDSANLKLITIDPPVADLRFVALGNGMEAQGKFDTSVAYQLTLKAGLLTVDGFQLAEDSVWKITFGPKRPAIILPERYVFQRASAPTVRGSFVQVNTDNLEWKIARIPRQHIVEVSRRVREFGYFLRDKESAIQTNEETGEYLYRPTELLIPELNLPVVASGTVEASDADLETPRQWEWKPGHSDPGIFLLEISGRDLRGREIGNRSIISRTDWMLTRLSSYESEAWRVSSMTDGKPVPGVQLEAFDYRGRFSGLWETDANGEARPKPAAENAATGEEPAGEEWTPTMQAGILAGAQGRESLHLENLPHFPSGNVYALVSDGERVGVIVTDRNFYRPGETVKFKGFLRTLHKGSLSIARNTEVLCQIESDTEVLAHEFKTVLSETGSFEGEWKTPSTAYGKYTIKAETAVAEITVSEFRPPPFSVVTESADTQGDTVTAKVSSVHFHGAPNAGAKVRWKAEWIAQNWRSDEDMLPADSLELDDRHSPDSPSRGFSGEVILELQKAGWATAREDREVTISATVQGEATLDAWGRATLQSKSPFAPGIHARAKVFWIIDITSAATAQTVRGGTVANVQFVPQILGVALQHGAARSLVLQVRSLDVADRPASGLAAKAEIFLVEVKTVKERLAPGIHRYRNTPLFHKVSEENVVTPADVSVPVKTGGRYVARVTAPQQPGTPPVSAEVTLEELEKETSFGVNNESSLQVTSERKRYRVGEDVVLTVQSPITGIATVSVQSDRVHHSEVVELKGNAQRITIRALPDFAPNAWVCVHIIKPAPADSLPAERFGSCEIKVDRPEQRLEVTPVLASDVLAPGAKTSGVIRVRAEGKPVAGADVLVFAVDEAVLALGRWQLPDFFQTFFPRRGWKIRTSTALGGLWTPEKPQKLTHSQKGFILGDAGPIVASVTFRKEFKALAFWNANMRSSASGEVPFEFIAPEGLTSYRVVAVAQSGADQFGHGRATLRLTKRLQVEPVLPAFLRNDDEVTLLTAVRQDHAESDEIDVAVTVDAGIVLAEPAAKRVKAKRGEPVVVGFLAKAAPDATRAKVGFAAKSVSRPEIKDGEENSFVIHPPTIERHETVSGTFAPPKPLNIAAATPPQWLQAKGRCDVILSGSPFLPKLAGLPALLEAQGSAEKLASRILAATLLAETLEYLPAEGDAERQLRTKVNDALKRFAQTVIPLGGMPAWPGADKANEKRNDFVTIEAAWAIRNAARRKFEVDEKLLERAKTWLSSIIGEDIEFGEVSPSMRCFALMAYSSSLGEEEKDVQGAENAAEDLFHARDELRLTVEDRAWLALAMHYLGILPQERETLLRELEKPIEEIAFDPMTWSSKARAEVLRLLARSEIESTNWSKATRQQALKAFDKITQSAVDLSTHENLWLLLLFNSLTRGDIPPAMDKLSPKPPALSKNKISAGWLRLPLSKLRETFAQPVQSKVPGTYLIRASYQVPAGGVPAGETHFKLERTFRNLTDASRTGLPAAPWKQGDQILVTYNLDVDRAHSHLELEDQLPACLETENPKMQALAEHYQLPIEAGVNALQLSHVELRFARTLLYFEKAAPGQNVYSVLAQVMVPGTFRWPSTQVRPMYDSRFSAVSGSQVVTVQ